MSTLTRPPGRPATVDHTLCVRTDAATAEYVRTQAALTGKSVSWVVTEIVRAWRASKEDQSSD